MTFSRRSFVSRGTLMLAGTALLPGADLEAAGGRATAVALPLTPTDHAVLDWIRSYSTEVRLVGSGVLGKMRHSPRPKTHFLAKVSDIAVLTSVVAGPLPFGSATLYAVGNTFTVTLNGTEFIIENLLADDFNAALAARLVRTKTVFATDALSWNPDTNGLTDPFRATAGGSLKLIHPGIGASVIFASMLRSYAEAETANVTFDLSIRTYWRRVLALSGAGDKAAGPITDELIWRLPQLADTRSRKEVIALLTSRLVTSAVRHHLQLDTHSVILRFAELRAECPDSISDAGIWLSIILAPEIANGTASAWIAGVEQPQQERFAAAIIEAEELIGNAVAHTF